MVMRVITPSSPNDTAFATDPTCPTRSSTCRSRRSDGSFISSRNDFSQPFLAFTTAKTIRPRPTAPTRNYPPGHAKTPAAAFWPPPLDPPPYYWLEGVVSLAALVMTVLILTTENRLSEMDEQRSRLHLQISMTSDRKAAKIIQLLEELRYDMPSVMNREDPEAAALTLPADPHEVALELEKRTPTRGELPQD